MKLRPEWKRLIRYAWSIRLNIIASILSGGAVWFTIIDPYSLPISNGVFALLALFVNIAAGIAVVVSQKEFRPSEKKYEDESDD